jgi:pseudouridine kinase
MAEGVLVIGAANFDIKGRMLHPPVITSSNSSAIRTSFGGVARNIAENLAKLGAPVTLLTAVGYDYAGEDILSTADDAGVDVSRAIIAENETTGTYLAALDESGDLYLGLDDLRVLRHITPDYLRLNRDAFRECAMVAFDLNLSEEAMLTAIHLAHEYGKPICVDPTSTVLAGRLRSHLPMVNIATPNIAEAEAILRCGPIRSADEALSAARQLVSLGVEAAVITQAESGACYATEEESGQFPAVRVEIVDTTGAGDSLTATMIFGQLNGFSMSDSVQLGLRAAALTLRTIETVAPELSLDRLYGFEDELALRAPDD